MIKNVTELEGYDAKRTWNADLIADVRDALPGNHQHSGTAGMMGRMSDSAKYVK